jgi:hypothetical protein
MEFSVGGRIQDVLIVAAAELLRLRVLLVASARAMRTRAMTGPRRLVESRTLDDGS